MPLNYSGYRTAASGWIEGLLADSNHVVDVCGFKDGTDDWIFIATDSGVCAIRRDGSGNSTRFGWLTQADIRAICTDETSLWIAWASGLGDIGRIAVSDLQTVDAIEGVDLPSGSEVRITATGHGLATGDKVYFQDDVGGTIELRRHEYAITVVDSDRFTLDGTDGDDFSAWTSGGAFVQNAAARYTAAYGSANGMFDAAQGRDVTDICCQAVAGLWRLAYLFESENGAYAGEEPHFCAVGAVGGPYYITGVAYGAMGAKRIRLANDGTLFVAKGPSIAYKVNAHAIDAPDWNFDAGAGNLDFDPSACGLNAAWSKFRAVHCSAASIAVGSNLLTLACTVDTDDEKNGITQYGGMLTRSFDIRVTGGSGADPTLDDAGEACFRRLRFFLNASNHAYIEFQSYWHTGNGRVEYRAHASICKNGDIYEATAEFGTAAPTGSAALRIVRTGGSQIDLSYNVGGGWQLLLTETGATLSASGVIGLMLLGSSVNGDSFDWNISGIANYAPEDFYSAFTAGRPITGLDAYDVGGILGFSRALVCFDDDGAAILRASTDWIVTPSTVVTFGTSGKDCNVLSSDNVTAVMFDRETPFQPKFWAGSADAGIDVVSDFGFLLGTANTTQGKVLDNAIAHLAYVGSAVYGTDSGCATPGAGFLAGGFYNALTDTDAYAAPAADTTPNAMILTGCRKPGEADYDYSVLYRQVNGGAWQYLRNNGYSAPTWDTVGARYAFDNLECEDFLVYQDLDLADGKYIYRWAHVNDAAVESTGTETLPVFIDEPAGVFLTPLCGATTSEYGIVCAVGANSGDDSGNETQSGDIFAVRIEQSGAHATWYLVAGMGRPPWALPFSLAGAAGPKTLTAYAYDRIGNFGASAPVMVTYDGAAAAHPSVAAGPMIAYAFFSDRYATLSCAETDSDFVEANVQDRRLAKVWQGEPIGTLSTKSYVFYVQFWDYFDQSLFFLKHHSFGSPSLADCDLWLCGHTENLGTYGDNWIVFSDFKVNLGALRHRECIVHRPERVVADALDHWALVIKATRNPVIPHSIRWCPYIGRMAWVREADIWQPGHGCDADIRRKQVHKAILNETDDLALVSRRARVREDLHLGFSFMDPADCEIARAIFEQRGRGDDLLVLASPDDYRTGEDAPQLDDVWQVKPFYGQYDQDPTYLGKPAGLTSFDLEFREIIAAVEE